MVEIMVLKHKLKNSQPLGNCPKHQQPLEQYCEEKECHAILCAVCIDMEHKDHKVIGIREKFLWADTKMKQIKEDLPKLRAVAKERLASLSTMEAHLEACAEKLGFLPRGELTNQLRQSGSKAQEAVDSLSVKMDELQSTSPKQMWDAIQNQKDS